MASIRATGCCSPSIRGSVSGAPLVVPAAGSVLLIRRALYWKAARPAEPAACPRRRAGSPDWCGEQPLSRDPLAWGAHLRGGAAVVAAEGLGELSRPAVANGKGHGRHGRRARLQQLGGA